MVLENILEKIVKSKINWIKHRKKIQPLSSFQHNITLSDRNFIQALKNIHPALILEFKKHSPSLGILNDFNPEFVAKIYKKYASAISVLTDEKYFHGKFEFIPIIRNIAVQQPILCKDFFIDPYQIYLARYYQADSILLMLSILKDNQYRALEKLAYSLNMAVLTEINNKMELDRAINLNAKIIGINNRNLKNFSISTSNTYKLASKISKNTIVISESGINSYNQLRKFKNLVQGFLIGSALMSKKDLEHAVHKIITGNNKICGLTRVEDARMSKDFGAIYGGFIFCKSSKRYVNLKKAMNITKNVHMKYIGVFCNENISTISYIIDKIPLYAIQLHGNENQFYIDCLKKKIPKCVRVWKAISLNGEKKHANNLFDNVNKHVFDNIHGGSGTPFNWYLLKNYNLKNVILAGGLNIKNCISASDLGCFGLDFNSGIEISPGLKDKKKTFLIFRSLREHKTIIH
uniref:Tryptophan biosynthesis protein TrpCF n=1 Tax=Buchnera aphidicola subsp. Schlechtendalia chinensis TaxID=118110 RepID=TRPC_BUCSC|nr:RecName: Full=Tryptophan biosynthesis protein TrpCF; Includes: RecName: Full=Indole-3-glycerol phosphate synthase; Short=IGPS; Includes: RecName: Full=N-(5'-phospho-ribosyl)anthranilate isomerase; Short=PRAI [Buchnera aphidicola (Schlechtendalia chinensis)]AAA92795.1 phosphoribosyl anthranilate isomerase/indoleglycerol phosphate synthase fusion [Buchnera aphidicola]